MSNAENQYDSDSTTQRRFSLPLAVSAPILPTTCLNERLEDCLDRMIRERHSGIIAAISTSHCESVYVAVFKATSITCGTSTVQLTPDSYPLNAVIRESCAMYLLAPVGMTYLYITGSILLSLSRTYYCHGGTMDGTDSSTKMRYKFGVTN